MRLNGFTYLGDSEQREQETSEGVCAPHEVVNEDEGEMRKERREAG